MDHVKRFAEAMQSGFEWIHERDGEHAACLKVLDYIKGAIAYAETMGCLDDAVQLWALANEWALASELALGRNNNGCSI